MYVIKNEGRGVKRDDIFSDVAFFVKTRLVDFSHNTQPINITYVFLY